MRFNFISPTGDGMGFAVRLKAEGNDARIYIRDKEGRSIGEGLVDKCGSIEEMLVDADTETDVFIFDSTGDGIVADKIRDEGFGVLGTSVVADRLERDREYGSSIMEECGIAIPETFSFTSWDDAIAFTEETKDRLVYKPSKHLGDLSCSHVSYDQEDMLELLHNHKAEVDIEKPEFELQKFHKGIAFSTEGYFDGHNFIEPLFNHTLERKELMDGNLGPSGGCTGNIVWACGHCPVCEETRKLAGFLRKNNYVGMIDLNAIIAKDGIYGLEFTPRFGYDASPTLFWELLDGELGHFFHDVAKGQYGPESPKLKQGFGGAVRLTIPPWPTERYTAEDYVPIRGLKDNDWNNTYFYNVRTDIEGKLCSAGAWGILLLFTGYGSSVGRSLSRPYDLAEAVRVPDKQYRLDLKKQFEGDLAELESLIGEVEP